MGVDSNHVAFCNWLSSVNEQIYLSDIHFLGMASSVLLTTGTTKANLFHNLVILFNSLSN